MSHSPDSQTVPIAIWPSAQTSAQGQRAGRYLPESANHRAKMLPALARRIIETYSQPGGLVVDPMAGIGTTVVEAADLGRRAIGVEVEDRWARLAHANVDHVVAGSRRRLGEVRTGDARMLTTVLGDVSGQVDLIAFSPPHEFEGGGCEVDVIDRRGRICPKPLGRTNGLNCCGNRDNIGHARDNRYRAEMAEVYAQCFAAVGPGGFVVTVTKNMRRQGRLVDLGSLTVELVREAGFAYIGHVISLLCEVRNSTLVAHPSLWQVRHLGTQRVNGTPLHLVVHQDVQLFVKPQMSASSQTSKPVQRKDKGDVDG